MREVFTATIIPSHQSQTTVQLNVYSTPNFDVKYKQIKMEK